MDGSRLREERLRLGLSQAALGERIGVQKRTILDWEKNRTSPTGAHLSALSEHGVDVVYVITGKRYAPGVDDPETRHMVREAMLREPAGDGALHDLLDETLRRKSEHYRRRLNRLGPLMDRLAMCSEEDFALVEAMLGRIFDGRPKTGGEP